MLARLALVPSRLDALITRERVRNYSWIFLVLGGGALLVNVALGQHPFTLAGEVAAPDYLAHWTGARLVTEGRTDLLYDPAAQSLLQHRELPQVSGLFWFVSPPVAVWLYLPLAGLAFSTSALLWTVVSVALLVLSLSLARPLVQAPHPRDHRVLLVVFVASAPVLELLGAGQDSAVALVLLMLGIRLLSSGHNVAAGTILALGIFKPQLFVLVPLVLLVQQRYRALGAFLGVAAGICALSVPLLGLRTWAAWLNALTSPLYQQGVQVGQTWKMQSLPGLTTALGAPPWMAYAVLLGGAAALALRAWKARTDIPYVWALTVLTTVVFSPHLMLYDLVILLPAAAFVCSRMNTATVRLLALSAAGLLATVALRHSLSQPAGPLALLAAPWSAVPLFGLWLALMHWKEQQSPKDRELEVGSATAGHA